MRRILFPCMAATTWFLAAVTPCPAQSMPDDKTLSPYFFVEDGDPEVDQLPLKETRADVQIVGVIADVIVTQVYRNEGTRPIHARYVFPASTRAAVHGMTLEVGGRRIRAEIREKEAAREKFEKARHDGKSAALLEQRRPNVFSMSVANIMPQDEVVVELHYSELLVPTEGTYEFVYPTVVGPRYPGQSAFEADADVAWVRSPYLEAEDGPVTTFDIQTEVAAGTVLMELDCTSHATQVEWPDAHTAVVNLDPGESAGGNRDYILRYRLADREVETGLLLYPGDEEGYFLLLVEPPVRVAPARIPPREYIFVLDVSGSMHGFPLNTAKSLMRELVAELRPIDRFNVVLFAGGARLLSPTSLAATPRNLRNALTQIDRERGGGGSELEWALEAAFDLPGEQGVARSTIVVTDGYVSAERSVFDLVRQNLDRSNVFAFGIGSSVNRHLIEGIARAGAGEPFVVTEKSEAAAAADRLHRYVASPVLVDIELAIDGFEAYDLEPESIPDLFADRPLVIFGKWEGEAVGTIGLSGSGGDGYLFEEVFDVASAQSSDAYRPLRYLWARSRVQALMDAEGLERSDEIRREITRLGLDHELLTPYTSFVAVHEIVRNPDADGTDVDQPLPMPAGVSNLAVIRSVPEPGLAMLLVGLLWSVAVLRYLKRMRTAPIRCAR